MILVAGLQACLLFLWGKAIALRGILSQALRRAKRTSTGLQSAMAVGPGDLIHVISYGRMALALEIVSSDSPTQFAPPSRPRRSISRSDFRDHSIEAPTTTHRAGPRSVWPPGAQP